MAAKSRTRKKKSSPARKTRAKKTTKKTTKKKPAGKKTSPKRKGGKKKTGSRKKTSGRKSAKKRATKKASRKKTGRKKTSRTGGKKSARGKKRARIASARRKRPSSGQRKDKKPTRPLKIVRTVKDMRRYLSDVGAKRRKVALVPTMGYLHEGHLSLVREARRLASVVVVSVFVNPAQFGPAEDLDRYPRDLSGDRRKLRREGASVLFAPDTAEIYPEGFQTYVEVTEVTRDYCGASRPGHFRGVTTVVSKLFNIVKPDVAIFGQKDFQQLVAIRRLVKDLDMQVEIVGMPTFREEDGLAMSSRNAYLSPSQRQQATAIFRGLRKAKRLLDSGERDSAELAAIVLDLLREEQDMRIEYVAVCDPQSLERVPEVESEAVLLVAVRIGDTRLIDNIQLNVRRKRARRK